MHDSYDLVDLALARNNKHPPKISTTQLIDEGEIDFFVIIYPYKLLTCLLPTLYSTKNSALKKFNGITFRALSAHNDDKQSV